jgi:hypothetical protein
MKAEQEKKKQNADENRRKQSAIAQAHGRAGARGRFDALRDLSAADSPSHTQDSNCGRQK